MRFYSSLHVAANTDNERECVKDGSDVRQMMMPGSEGSLQQGERQSARQRGELQLSVKDGGRLKEADGQRQQMMLKRALKKKRSADYMNAIRLIDAGGAVLDQAAFDLLVNEIQSDLGPLDSSIAQPVGIIDKCYLGDPYEVHMLDTTHNIIEHFEKGRPLPGVLEKYRGMAASGSYDFIEVYANCACAVRSNGQVTLIEV